jgi:Ca-activated chloride channel family protein
MTFAELGMLWLLALMPVLVIAYAFDGQRRRRLLEKLGHHPMIARMTASASPARRRWRAVLTVTAVTLIVGALARPQIPGRAKLTESRGLDLVVALDFSRSMLARDVYPSRLERAKAELAHLIDTLKGDRVGMVAFAGETMSYPLTVDYEAAKLFWRDLGPDDMPVGGTDLGRAVRASTELLVRVRRPDRDEKKEEKKRAAQVILLLTDGEDTEGQGIAAAREAAKQGIRVYTLGIGSNDKPYVQLTDAEGKPAGYLEDAEGKPVRVGVDEAALRQIAAVTGGDYFNVDPKRFGVARVQQAIAGLQRTQEEARFEREPEDVGRWFLLPAFLLLVAEACVRERRRRVSPANASANVSANANAVAAAVLVLLMPALTGFDLFMRRDPNIEDGNKLLEAGKAADALKAYDRAAEALPDEPIVRFDRGTALYQLGKYAEAQKEFQRASEGSGRDPRLKADAYYNMGNAYFQQQRWKEALDAYKRTLSLRPEDRRAKWNLELAQRKLKETPPPPPQPQSGNDQKEQEQQKEQQQKEQQQKEQQQKEQQQKEQQQKEQQQKEQQQKEQQQKEQQQKEQQQKEQQQSPTGEGDKKPAAKVAREPARDIDRQDAEAVLDALERVEPTVQKDLARRRAGSRRPSKDW